MVKQITDPKVWDSFVQSQVYTLFVQSSYYGKFYEQMGERSMLFGIYEHDVLIGGTLAVTTHAKRGTFLYVPYGPLLPKGREEELLPILIAHIVQFSKKEGVDFIRVSPFIEETDETKRLYKNNAFRDAPIHVLAETTWLLDIQPTEEEILSHMNKNHRNLIRRCEREGVRVVQDTSSEALEDLNKLLNHTVKRHNFVRFSEAYIKNEFTIFAAEDKASIFRAYLPDGTLDAAAIIMFYGNMACYRHSASLGSNSKLPSSYLIQWRVIQEAKQRQMHWYNFWGIAPESAPKHHPFRGITHFKKGFGGFQYNLLHCQDLPLNKKYWMNWGIETIRRIKRGF